MSLAGPTVADRAENGAWTILDTVTAVIEELTAAGLRASWDLDELNPPGLYLQLPVVRWTFAAGGYEADHTLYLVAANTNRDHAVRELADLLVTVQATLAGRIVTGRPVDVPTRDGTRNLPAYELTWTDYVKRRPPAGKRNPS